jgi:glycosyltransferase involved in cell wall biosynthesis
MYFSNAIITTPYTSIKNIVKDKQLGLLIEPNNIQEIGEAILELVKNELVLKKYCINSRKFAEQELNWDLIVKKINSEIQKSSYL